MEKSLIVEQSKKKKNTEIYVKKGGMEGSRTIKNFTEEDFNVDF